MSKNLVHRIEAWICLVIEILAIAYRIYLQMVAPPYREMEGGLLGLDLLFGWAAPALLLIIAYINSIRWDFYAISDGDTFWFGVGAGVFGCFMLALFGGRSVAVASEAISTGIVHIALPVGIFLINKLISGELNESAKTLTPKDLGNLFFKLVVSAAALALGIWLTFLVIQSDVFGNSLIVIGFIPIPGQIFSVFPAVLAIIGIIFLWSRE